jgi:hypothetical protein
MLNIGSMLLGISSGFSAGFLQHFIGDFGVKPHKKIKDDPS